MSLSLTTPVSVIVVYRGRKTTIQQQHGGESRDLNDRVHGISCRYSDNTNKQTLSYFSLYPTDFHKTKRTYLLIIRSKRSSESYSTMCSSFLHKSEQTLFSVFRLCFYFFGIYPYIVERHLNVWLPGIMRRYVHFIA